MPKSDKITKTEKLKRVQKVMELLATGHRRAQIQQYAAEKSKWNVSEDMIEHYIHDAYEEFKAAAEVDRDTAYHEAVARLRWALTKTAAVMDYQRFIAAARELNKLQGLYPPETLRVIKGVDMEQLTALAQLMEAKGVEQLTKLVMLLQAQGETAGDAFETLVQALAGEDAPRP